jgi:hypothetical protein
MLLIDIQQIHAAVTWRDTPHHNTIENAPTYGTSQLESSSYMRKVGSPNLDRVKFKTWRKVGIALFPSAWHLEVRITGLSDMIFKKECCLNDLTAFYVLNLLCVYGH